MAGVNIALPNLVLVYKINDRGQALKNVLTFTLFCVGIMGNAIVDTIDWIKITMCLLL